MEVSILSASNSSITRAIEVGTKTTPLERMTHELESSSLETL